eukprot:Opistho-2@4620
MRARAMMTHRKRNTKQINIVSRRSVTDCPRMRSERILFRCKLGCGAFLGLGGAFFSGSLTYGSSCVALSSFSCATMALFHGGLIYTIDVPFSEDTAVPTSTSWKLNLLFCDDTIDHSDFLIAGALSTSPSAAPAAAEARILLMPLFIAMSNDGRRGTVSDDFLSASLPLRDDAKGPHMVASAASGRWWGAPPLRLSDRSRGLAGASGAAWICMAGALTTPLDTCPKSGTAGSAVGGRGVGVAADSDAMGRSSIPLGVSSFIGPHLAPFTAGASLRSSWLALVETAMAYFDSDDASVGPAMGALTCFSFDDPLPDALRPQLR